MANKKAKKAASKKMTRWVTLPGRDWMSWFGQWLIASMVMEAWKQQKKIPTEIRVREECIEDQPDGTGLIYYECKFGQDSTKSRLSRAKKAK